MQLRPVSCVPLTRDPNPRHFELNDALGNYSLTLIDSLSTLAILASAPPDEAESGPKALRDFQDGVKALIEQYGDGTEGKTGQGLRARGFDLDSKVQVFETVIRGVGGLLSAHLFAAGDLPIRGYEPKRAKPRFWQTQHREIYPPIIWPNGLRYDGQLLRLALDLAQRLLPAFYTKTGLPYPRVNLRHGIPFFPNSPLHGNNEDGQCKQGGAPEVTETCSAGAGSLVLEFTVLSRLVGDPRFEQLAKRAFWAVWNRRSSVDLIGAGVDAEEGHWIGGFTGIGAGVDSFFEYALKTHILLSGQDTPNTTINQGKKPSSWLDPTTLWPPLSEEDNSADTFLHTWKTAHAAIKRHLYSNHHHPHYVNVFFNTGSPQAFWIDSLGAYYPGLLTLAGELEEAIETHLLYTALWTRYSALPERWHVQNKVIEQGIGWWPGRPEFIESNYHIYRATEDPWYLHVGEMVLKDITKRCWTKCGWAGLQDAETGVKQDRMESFFLGETAKYLYLLFDKDHPLNSLDAPFVFTTEGHPLIIPRKQGIKRRIPRSRTPIVRRYDAEVIEEPDVCPAGPRQLPLTISATAARPDIFHAASYVNLHEIENIHLISGDETASIRSSRPGHQGSANYTFFPWTLPIELVPADGFCPKVTVPAVYQIQFPAGSGGITPTGVDLIFGAQGVVRLEQGGFLIKSLSGLKLQFVEEESVYFNGPRHLGGKSWRVTQIGTLNLGRDEKVFVDREVIRSFTDPSFSFVENHSMLDMVVQMEQAEEANNTSTFHVETNELDAAIMISTAPDSYKTYLSSLLQQVTSKLRDPAATILPQPRSQPLYRFFVLPGTLPTGLGAAPLPSMAEAPNPALVSDIQRLSWTKFYFAGDACTSKLPDEAVRSHQVIVMRRGGCSFSEKLANVPSFAPSKKGFQFLVIVSEDKVGEDADGMETGGSLIHPLLDQQQRTPSGLLRHHLIPMALVGGGEETYDMFKQAKSVGVRKRYHVESLGMTINNLIVV